MTFNSSRVWDSDRSDGSDISDSSDSSDNSEFSDSSDSSDNNEREKKNDEIFFETKLKNPLYGRQRISRPMRIVAPITKKSW